MTYTAERLTDQQGNPVANGWLVTDDETGQERKVFAAPANDTAEAAIAVVTAPPPPEPDQIDVFRESASLSKFEFLTAARRAGVLSNADYLTAANGGWPTAFADALTGMSEDEQIEAQGLWATTTEVRRNAPLLEALIASNADITAEGVDALFGWSRE